MTTAIKERKEGLMTEANAYSLTQEGAQKLSTHFRVREFACKDGSDPLFISPQLVQLLEQVRTHFNAPVFVNSGYRTPAYNHSIPHASPHSQHLYGRAADIRVCGHAPAQVAAYAETLLPHSGGIGLYPSFVHLDVSTAKRRWKG